MKQNLLLLLAMLLTSVASFAQAPPKFNYQGVARDAAGNPIASQAIGLRISVLDGSSTGSVVFSETQTPLTNAYGLFSIAIGTGTPISGSIGAVNWASGDKYVKIDMDPNGGSAYSNLTTTQL